MMLEESLDNYRGQTAEGSPERERENLRKIVGNP